MFFRNPYRYLVRANDEGARTHEAVIRLLHKLSCVDSMLDIGCADGTQTLQYAKLLGISAGNVQGIEVREHCLQKASARFTVHSIDLEKDKLPLGKNAVDLIICN